jgi:1,4-dihydroxy-2-naphthoate octaprenyltransferase
MQNDRSDLKKGVDRPETRGGSRVLVEGLMTPETMRKAFWVCLLVSLAIGVGLVLLRGWELLVIGLLGLAGGLSYSFGGAGYKYRALGEPMVGLLMGPGMVIGAHVALGGAMTTFPLLASIPVACIVMAILASNNLRDRDHDIQAGIQTLAIALGPRGAAVFYTALLLGAPLSVVALVLAGVLPLPALAPLVTAPLFLRNVRWALRGVSDPDKLVNLDVATAQLHMLFGLLLTGGLVAGVLFGGQA